MSSLPVPAQPGKASDAARQAAITVLPPNTPRRATVPIAASRNRASFTHEHMSGVFHPVPI
jgi:hypothetical protein